MFFLWQRNCKQYKNKRYLTHFECESKQFVLHSAKFPLVQILSVIKKAVRRMSFSFLPFFGVFWKKLQGNLKAGVSVEAAMIMPLFLFFVLNLFSVIEMLRFHGNVAWALNETGGQLAVYGYAKEMTEKERDTGVATDVAISYLYVKEKMLATLGEEYVQSAPLSEGADGILFSKAQILEDDCIDLTVTYQLKMPFGVGDVGEARLYNCYKARLWTGYDVSDENGSIVYVAKTGKVYHRRTDCPSLKIKKRQEHKEELEDLRNLYGEKYSACEYCCKTVTDYIWITEDGNKYHEKADCSALKRTVIKVREKQAREKGYETCKRCGNN